MTPIASAAIAITCPILAIAALYLSFRIRRFLDRMEERATEIAGAAKRMEDLCARRSAEALGIMEKAGDKLDRIAGAAAVIESFNPKAAEAGKAVDLANAAVSVARTVFGERRPPG